MSLIPFHLICIILSYNLSSEKSTLYLTVFSFMKLCLTSNFIFCEKDANLKILGHKVLLSAIILEAKFCLYDCIFFFSECF